MKSKRIREEEIKTVLGKRNYVILIIGSILIIIGYILMIINIEPIIKMT